MQVNLPSLTTEQIEALEDFTKSLQSPLFKRPANKAALIQKYISLVQSISFESFWQGMAAANIPQPRPEGFESWEIWTQIEWIRQSGLSVAWTFISLLKAQAKGEQNA
ncbi:MAG TPA: hypothetical protein V6D27_01135 [Vampirovibrionales bacterium]